MNEIARHIKNKKKCDHLPNSSEKNYLIKSTKTLKIIGKKYTSKFKLIMQLKTCIQLRKIALLPDVILSGPNTSSSAARPPIIMSIIASSCDLVTWYLSFSGM